jgi:hypothetical protein
LVADEFTIVAQQILAAREPEEVFGDAETWKDVRRVYRRLARIVHPDTAGAPAVEAERAFQALERLWERARDLLARDEYGKERAPSVRVTTKRATYLVGSKIATGDFCDVFDARLEGLSTPRAFKVARLPRDNDLVRQEALTLRRLVRDLDDRWHPFLPALVDQVEFRAPGGIRRRANVLDRLDGWYSLEQVRVGYPGGVDARDMAWMLRRLLAILGAVHEAGVVHGAVVPSNVMIHPEKHGLTLIDWAYAIEVGGRPRAVSGAYRGMYPPELEDDRRLSPASDLWLAGQTMKSLLPVVPSGTPKPIRAYFRALALPERLRPDDAWLMQQTFDDVLERCYGRRRFRPFAMPAPA